MDFWSRLVGNPQPSEYRLANPQKRLQQFRKHFEHIWTIYDKNPLLRTDNSAAETLRASLHSLTTILQDESRLSQSHICLSFVDSGNIYQTIGRIGTVAQHDGIIREAVAFFATLVDADQDEFLSNRRFCRTLMTFVNRTADSANLFVSEQTGEDIVELLFSITARIRLQPRLLSFWFHPVNPSDSSQHQDLERNAFVGLTSRTDFPLCYQLMDHVHHGGRMGDFARTGLLYIFETSSKSSELERWIIESDLPILMATGLGALYSQLGRKLSIVHAENSLPIILQLSDYAKLQAPHEAESLFSDHLQAYLETFLTYLAFWQDVLESCTSAEVHQSLLDHFQILFLQQLLYPSLLESSDSDGGSSVAVLTYIRYMLTRISDPEFVKMILQYLLALPQDSQGLQNSHELGMESSDKSIHHYAAMKRTSLLLLAQSFNQDQEATPEFFNLADLVRSSIRSISIQTSISALKLTAVLLQENHSYAVGPIIKTQTHYGPLQRTHGALTVEMRAYLIIAAAIGGESGMDEAYESHVQDSQQHLESHCCTPYFLTLRRHGMPYSPDTTMKTFPQRHISTHALQLEDSFFKHLGVLLAKFLVNNVELNLSLTQVMLALAACPFVRLEDWLNVNPLYYQFNEALDADLINYDTNNNYHPDILKLHKIRREPIWDDNNAPLLLKSFQNLSAQIQQLKTRFPALPQIVNARKQAFRLHDEIKEATIKAPQRTNLETPFKSASSSPSTRALSSSFPNHLSPQTESTTHKSHSSRGKTSDKPRLAHRPTGLAGLNLRSESYVGNTARFTPTTPPPSLEYSGAVIVEQNLEGILKDIIAEASSELLSRSIQLSSSSVSQSKDHRSARKSSSSTVEDVTTEVANDDNDTQEVSLNHIVTNIVILQEFILELVAVMQIRASFYGEIML